MRTYRVEHPVIMVPNAFIGNFIHTVGAEIHRQVTRRGLAQAKVKAGSYLRVVNVASRVLLAHLGKSRRGEGLNKRRVRTPVVAE